MLKKKKFVNAKKKKFIKSKPRVGFFQKKVFEITQSLELLAKINFRISWRTLKIILLLLSALGIVLGVGFRNVLLGVILGIAFPMLFIEYLSLKKSDIESYIEKQVTQYAELIKNSFISTNSVMQSIKTITPRMSEPSRTIFQELITEVEVYNYSVEFALNHMCAKLESNSLSELTQQLVLCQRDQRFISSLQTTTKFMADKREFLQMWEYKIKSMYQKLSFMVFLVNAMAVSAFFMYRDIFEYFLNSRASKIVIPIFILMQLIAVIRASKKIKNMQF